ncbi:MAG TPA: glycosyl hydrolase, partial [Phycisphaerae bacterium]|nr:glycosyl hydrolase [Phycisphaerae bacterium]
MRRIHLATLLSLACLAATARADVTDLQKRFQTPPDESRIMVRWWWFGPAVTKAGIDRELASMKAGGINGFEVQPTYPLVVDSPQAKNLKWMSPEFLEMIGHTAARAKETGMRFDLTLGSGWPYGGPMFNQATEGTKALSTNAVNVAAGQKTVQTNSRTAFAAFAGPGGAPTGGGGRGGGGGGGDMSAFKEIPLVNGTATLPDGFAGGQVIFFDYRSAGLTAVKRPAYGADGPIIDHLSAEVVDKFINLVAEPELKACGSNPPFSFFCDSLEVNGENWTPNFLAEFQKRRGYDLKPLLPALIGNFGPKTADIKHDYGMTVTELFNENFNAKFTALAKKYNTRFRIQGYGSPPAALESYAYADLPEGEAGGGGTTTGWREFRATRFAASASHLMNQPLASSETFTWLHTAPFRAVPLDIKGAVDQQFLEGINQVDCHGWGYTPDTLPYPGGSFYAAAVFNEKNPWYVAMPEITTYMARVSQMLREGTPANDIALYANDADLWTAAGPGFSSMNAAYTSQSQVLGAVLDCGYNLDLFDDGMLEKLGKADGKNLAFGKVQYPIVLLNGPANMPLATARKLEAFAKAGGILVNVGNRLPSHVPGYKTTDADQKELADIFARLFANGGPGLTASNPQQFSNLVSTKLAPDFLAEPANPNLGAIHRHTDGGELYFIANTSAQKQTFQATFRATGTPEQWNPLNGKITPFSPGSRAGASTTLSLTLDPLASTVIVFTSRQLPAAPAPSNAQPLDLTSGWNVKFASGPGGTGNPVTMEKLADWTSLPNMANYSGVATYEKKVTVPAALANGAVVLTFGQPSAPAGGGGRGGNGYAAPLDSPVHDAAVVYVNDKRIGAAWCAPF